MSLSSIPPFAYIGAQTNFSQSTRKPWRLTATCCSPELDIQFSLPLTPGCWNISMLIPKECLESVSLLYNTESAFWRFLYWLYLCSLDPDCIAPSDSKLGCRFKPGDRFTSYANCHRFDQSILNIIAASYYNYTMESYLYSNMNERVAGIRRRSTRGAEKVKSCKSNQTGNT